MKTRLNILSFIMITICSCTTNKTTNNNTYETVYIPDSAIQSQDLIDNFVEDVKFIKLETTQESLISDQIEIQIGKKYIYILDTNFKSVMIFDKDGSFVKAINKGNGPGEINLVQKIKYDRENDELYVFQDFLINRYTANGTFINSYNINILAHDFEVKKGNFIFFQYSIQTQNQETTILEVDTLMNTINESTIGKEILIFGHSNMFTNGDCIKIYRYVDNNIYEYKDQQINIVEKIKFDGVEPDFSEITESNDYNKFDYIIAHTDNACKYIDFYAETDNYELFKIGTTIFRDKRNGHVINPIYNKFGISGLPKTILSNLEYIGSNDNYFIGYLSAQAKNIMGTESIFENNKKSFSEEEINIIKDMNDEDNPVLILFKFK